MDYLFAFALDAVGVLRRAMSRPRLVSTPSAQPWAARLGIVRGLSPPSTEFFQLFSVCSVIFKIMV